MNKIKILLFFVIICSFGCEETEIANNTRVLVKGKVVNENSNPLSNVKVSVYTDADAFESETYLLGEGFTNEDGEFNVTSLFGANTLFYVEVMLDDEFSTYRYQTNTKDFTPDDLIFDLETIELKRLSVFDYSFTRISGEDNTITFSFKYINPYCLEVFEDDVLDVFQSFCHFESNLNRTLNNNIPTIQNGNLEVPLGSIIEFSYSINDGEEVTEILNINTTNYEFEFSY